MRLGAHAGDLQGCCRSSGRNTTRSRGSGASRGGTCHSLWRSGSTTKRLPERRHFGDARRAARLHNSAGIVEWTRGRHELAIAHFEQALALFNALSDAAGAGLMMNSIGVSLSALGRWSEARARLQDALVHRARTGQGQLEAHALGALGDAYWNAGETDKAPEWYERSLGRRLAIGDRRGEGWMLHRLARAKATSGDREEAASLLARATERSTACADEELMDACEQLRQALERARAASSHS